MSDIKLGITFFSLAHPFAQHRLDLEGCLAVSREFGYEGIELVSAQMVPNYPTPDSSWCEQFRRLMDRYGLEGFAYGSYVDMTRFPGRNLTPEEIFQTSLIDLQTARRLGMNCLKSQCSMPLSVVRRLAPIARSMGIWLGFELHAPNHCRDQVWTPLFKVFDEFGPDVLGVVPDTGIFAARPHKLFLDAALKSGVPPHRLERITQLHQDGLSRGEAARALGPLSRAEEDALSELYREFSPAPLEDLDRMLPYCRYMHGKYFYVDEALHDDCVPFGAIVEKLKQHSYSGAVAAEYEGYFTEIKEDSVEQVRRFAAMLRSMI